MKRLEYVAALRELADYVEAREFPDTRLGYGNRIDAFERPALTFWLNDKRDFGLFAAAMGSFEKAVTDYSTAANHTTPTINVRVVASRETVCTKKVLGTRTVDAKPEEIIPAVEEHEEEIVAWECPESFVALGKQEGKEN